MTPQEQDYLEIPLTRGQVAKVSPHRFEELNRWKWHAQWDHRGKTYYANRVHIDGAGKRHTIAMHRYILGLKSGDRRTGDHQNHDTLDCRDDNLRISTHKQQCQNRRRREDNQSGYKGVSFEQSRKLWRADIYIDGHGKFLGWRNSPFAAWSELYVPAALKHYGAFACLE